MSVINVAINEFDLTEEEIGFIKTRHRANNWHLLYFLSITKKVTNSSTT
ncbi:hypothetical protein [Legionella bozemanae]|nr:hypothetical protein [Legionella bozemanae]